MADNPARPCDNSEVCPRCTTAQVQCRDGDCIACDDAYAADLAVVPGPRQEWRVNAARGVTIPLDLEACKAAVAAKPGYGPWDRRFIETREVRPDGTRTSWVEVANP